MRLLSGVSVSGFSTEDGGLVSVQQGDTEDGNW